MEKTLTISIAAYNVEGYIRKTLESLLDESIIDDLEILVIDDGGTDRTLEIAQEYAARYPQSIFPIHKENGGYGSTINTGIKRATGKYFKQLDGDDWYQTENLKEMIAIMKTVSVDCVLTDYIRFYEKDERAVGETPFSGIEEGEYELDQSGVMALNVMYVCAFRSILLKGMPYRLTEQCFYTDNEYVALPLPYLHTVYILHKAIYIYRIGAEGQSMNIAELAKHYKEHETVFWKLWDVYCSMPTEKETNKRLFENLMVCRLCEHYRYLCLLPDSSTARREILALNQRARQDCADILGDVIEKGRRFRALLLYPRFAFPLCRARVKQEWKEAGRLTDS